MPRVRDDTRCACRTSPPAPPRARAASAGRAGRRRCGPVRRATRRARQASHPAGAVPPPRRRGRAVRLSGAELDIMLAETEPALIAEAGGRANSSRTDGCDRPATRPMQPRDGHVSHTHRHRTQPVRHLRGRDDAGLRRAAAADDRGLPHLWHTQRGALQCRAGLPCADPRSVCRRAATRSPARRAGGTWWSGPAGRSTPAAISSSAPMCWAAAWAPPARAACATMATGPWGTDFPPVTIHDMVRAQKMLIDHLGITRLFAVLGGSMGGMQVLQWAASYPDAVFAALPIAVRRLSLGAEHRVPRGRAAGDLRRSGLAGRALLGERAHPRARPGGGADVRAHHLSVGGGADPEVRPAAAECAEGPERGDRPVRRDVRGAELSAPPGLHLRAAVRREFVSDDHAGDGLFRPGGGLRRRSWRMRSAARRRGSCWRRSPPTGCSRRRKAARSHGR